MGILGYIGVYWDILGYIGIYWEIFGYIGKYLENIGKYWGILGNIGVYLDILGYIGAYWDILGHIGAYVGIFLFLYQTVFWVPLGVPEGILCDGGSSVVWHADLSTTRSGVRIPPPAGRPTEINHNKSERLVINQ